MCTAVELKPGWRPRSVVAVGYSTYIAESPKQGSKRINSTVLRRRSALPILLYYLSMVVRFRVIWLEPHAPTTSCFARECLLDWAIIYVPKIQFPTFLKWAKLTLTYLNPVKNKFFADNCKMCERKSIPVMYKFLPAARCKTG